MAYGSRRLAYLTVTALIVGNPVSAAPVSGAKAGTASPGTAGLSGANPSATQDGGASATRTERQAPLAVDQDVAARSRMHECGHQWSAIKKAGNAGSRTWKEFSATCLVMK